MTERIDPNILDQLEQAIETLQADVQKVEIWAGAVSAFARPVPAYAPREDFVLPRRPSRHGAGADEE